MTEQKIYIAMTWENPYTSNFDVRWMMMMMMMISQFNGTSTPKGSHSAKTGVNYHLSPSKVHQKKCYGQVNAKSKVRFGVWKEKCQVLYFASVASQHNIKSVLVHISLYLSQVKFHLLEIHVSNTWGRLFWCQVSPTHNPQAIIHVFIQLRHRPQNPTSVSPIPSNSSHKWSAFFYSSACLYI